MLKSDRRKATIKRLLELLFKDSLEFKIGFESLPIMEYNKYNPMIRSMFYSNLAGKISRIIMDSHKHRKSFNKFMITNMKSFFNKEIIEIKIIKKSCDCISKIHSEFLLTAIITELFYNELMEEQKENI